MQPTNARRWARLPSFFSTSTDHNLELLASGSIQRDDKSRFWIGLTLATVGMAAAVNQSNADAKESVEGEKGDAIQIAERIHDRKVDGHAEVQESEKTKGTLQKRKTSVRDGNVLVSTAAVRGDREYMEDTSYVSSCKRFAAVYDGHGGSAVSQYLRNQLYAMLAPGLAELEQEMHAEKNESTNGTTKSTRRQKITTILRETIQKLDQDVIAKDEWKFQGSTAVGVLMFEDVLYSLNVGDSRAVLCRAGHAVELTRDHKANDPHERRRIESLGGLVRWFGYVDAQGEPIEPYGAYRVNGNLAVARAIGDRDSRPFVIGDAEVRQYDIEYDKDEFIVIASDGLWDVFSSTEVIELVQDVMSGELGGREAWSSGGHSDTRVPIFEWSQQYTSDRSMIKAARRRRKLQIAKYLVQEALFRGTSDNVSVIVVWLR